MRVIGGTARGRPLKAKLPASVRPTTDYAREAIFSMLESRGGLIELVVADLNLALADETVAEIRKAGGKATPGASSNGVGLLTVTGLPASRIGEIAASAGIVLHELTPLASLEEAFMELTSGSLEFGTHGADPVPAGEGTAR